MLQQLEAVNKYVAACTACMQHEAACQVMATQLGHLKRAFQTCTMSLDEAASTMQALSTCKWIAQEDVRELAAVISARAAVDVAPAAAQVATKHANQKNVHFHDYLTKSDWDVLLGDGGMTTKVACLVSRALCIGMHWPCEAAMVWMTAMLVSPLRAEMSMADAFALLQNIKTEMRRRRTCIGLPAVTLVDYPTAAEFMTMHGGCYGEDVAIPSKIGLSALQAAAAKIPARKTHTALLSDHQRPGAGHASRSPAETALQSLLATLTQCMAPPLQGCNLQMLRTPSPRRQRSTPAIKDAGGAWSDPKQPMESVSPAVEKDDNEDAADLVDNMVGKMRDALKEKAAKRAAGAPTPKAKGAKTAPRKAAAPKKAVRKPAGKATSPVPAAGGRPVMPKLAAGPHTAHAGCKIYNSATTRSWRVLRAGCRVDKAFKWGEDPAKVWKQVLLHCEGK